MVFMKLLHEHFSIFSILQWKKKKETNLNFKMRHKEYWLDFFKASIPKEHRRQGQRVIYFLFFFLSLNIYDIWSYNHILIVKEGLKSQSYPQNKTLMCVLHQKLNFFLQLETPSVQWPGSDDAIEVAC